jgi:hypothetical protein
MVLRIGFKEFRAFRATFPVTSVLKGLYEDKPSRAWLAKITGSVDVSIYCPMCFSRRYRRSKRTGVAEKTILSALCVLPFRCIDCGHRFFRLSMHRHPGKKDIKRAERERVAEGSGEALGADA